jgi:hypothetical protein
MFFNSNTGKIQLKIMSVQLTHPHVAHKKHAEIQKIVNKDQ